MFIIAVSWHFVNRLSKNGWHFYVLRNPKRRVAAFYFALDTEYNLRKLAKIQKVKNTRERNFLKNVIKRMQKESDRCQKHRQ